MNMSVKPDHIGIVALTRWMPKAAWTTVMAVAIVLLTLAVHATRYGHLKLP